MPACGWRDAADEACSPSTGAPEPALKHLKKQCSLSGNATDEMLKVMTGIMALCSWLLGSFCTATGLQLSCDFQISCCQKASSFAHDMGMIVSGAACSKGWAALWIALGSADLLEHLQRTREACAPQGVPAQEPLSTKPQGSPWAAGAALKRVEPVKKLCPTVDHQPSSQACVCCR